MSLISYLHKGLCSSMSHGLPNKTLDARYRIPPLELFLRGVPVTPKTM